MAASCRGTDRSTAVYAANCAEMTSRRSEIPPVRADHDVPISNVGMTVREEGRCIWEKEQRNREQIEA